MWIFPIHFGACCAIFIVNSDVNVQHNNAFCAIFYWLIETKTFTNCEIIPKISLKQQNYCHCFVNRLILFFPPNFQLLKWYFFLFFIFLTAKKKQMNAFVQPLIDNRKTLPKRNWRERALVCVCMSSASKWNGSDLNTVWNQWKKNYIQKKTHSHETLLIIYLARCFFFVMCFPGPKSIDVAMHVLWVNKYGHM